MQPADEFAVPIEGEVKGGAMAGLMVFVLGLVLGASVDHLWFILAGAIALTQPLLERR